MNDQEKMIYPDVLASVKPGDKELGYARWVEAVTNNQETVVRVSVYWYIPPRDFCERHGGPWGEDETCSNCTELDGSPKRQVTQPVLVVEIDDEVEMDMEGNLHPDNMDIRVRVRRNDGLIYDGTRTEQESMEES